MSFEYDCPADGCDGEMQGSFGDDVTCPVCGRTWATEWDYGDAYEGIMGAWITGPAEPEEEGP